MRDFSTAKRIVIKIGTQTLAGDHGVDIDYVASVARQVKSLLDRNQQVVIVSSGAIGMGATELDLTGPVKAMKMRQACAAIGQPLLMAAYRKAFGEYNISVGQVLLTAEVLDHRQTYLNLRTAIETLLELGVVPIINENDSVSTDEIGTAFGDNDRLSALVASKLDADLLIILSDVDRLYDKNPREYSDARPIDTVTEITDEIHKMAGGKGSTYSTGGMKTKIHAAQIASQAGCRIVLAHGRTEDIITRVLSGKPLGTLFLPQKKLSNRARWILHSTPQGHLYIDDGALAALKRHKSLLPSGITKVEGNFKAGDVVQINEQIKAVVSLSSDQITAILGKHSSEIKTILGPDCRDVVAIPEDIVVME